MAACLCLWALTAGITARAQGEETIKTGVFAGEIDL